MQSWCWGRVRHGLHITSHSLCVLSQVVGVVTRKDLAEPNAKLVLGHKASAGLTTASADDLVRMESLPFIPYGES